MESGLGSGSLVAALHAHLVRVSLGVRGDQSEVDVRKVHRPPGADERLPKGSAPACGDRAHSCGEGNPNHPVEQRPRGEIPMDPKTFPQIFGAGEIAREGA